jgi:AcrR family transcriptional regulator
MGSQPRRRQSKRAAKPAAPAARGSASSEDNGARERILNAAEELFAARGFNGVSVRDIVKVARVNLGAIPYYFGSKENLFKGVFLRRVAPIQAERAQRVASARDGGSRELIRNLLEAVIEPAFRHTRQNDAYRRLAGRTATDPTPEVRKIIAEIYKAHPQVLPGALREALAHLDDEEFFWRIMCVYGAMFYVQANTGHMQSTVAGKSFDSSRTELALKYVVPFLEAGLKAPPAAAPRRAGAGAKRGRRSKDG